MEVLFEPKSYNSQDFWQTPKMSSENKPNKNLGMCGASWQGNAPQKIIPVW